MIQPRKLLISKTRWKEVTGMKKLKNEKELVKKAIAAGMKYGEERGVVEFEPTDSATEKIEYIYRLLVHDKIIQPLPQDQVSQLSMKHRLAMWASKLN
jgi:pilus assembly protein TadC